MNQLCSFTQESLVFYTCITLNERFTRYRNFQNSGQHAVAMADMSGIGPPHQQFQLAKSTVLTANFGNPYEAQRLGLPDDWTHVGGFQDYSEPVVYCPIRASYRRAPMPYSWRKNKKRRKRRPKISKEKLDDEIDQYMIDIKYV